MKRRPLIFFTTLLILLLAAASKPSAQSPGRDARSRTASIGGRVTVGGAPAANALVTVVETTPQLRGEWANADSREAASFEVRTDGAGRYRVTGLAEGSYVIRAISKAYVLSNGLSGVEAFKQVTLDEGESRDDIEIALVRGGVITGRVTDAEGKPVIGVGLSLFPVDEKGKLKAELGPHGCRDCWQMFQTDDRGVYRIYGLNAGRYILSAAGTGAPNLLKFKSPETFYPDATVWAEAKIIDVSEGAEVTDIDIRLSAGNDRYEAAGRVVDDETGKPLSQLSVVCMQAPNEKSRGTRYGVPATTDDEGQFTCAGLDPGRYLLSLWNRTQVESEYYSEKIGFEIIGSNLSGLELKAIRGSTISGVVVIEGAGDREFRDKLQPMSVGLTIKGSADSKAPGAITAKISGDGSFRMTGAPAGTASFYLDGDRRNAFLIRRVERDGAEIRSAFEIGRGEHLTGFRIIVAQVNGTIRGQVDVGAVNLSEDCRFHIWAAPINAAPNNEGMPAFHNNLNRFTVADEKGRFVIEGLSPGEYELGINAMVRVDQRNWSSAPGTSEVKHRVTVGSGSETTVKITPGRRKDGAQ